MQPCWNLEEEPPSRGNRKTEVLRQEYTTAVPETARGRRGWSTVSKGERGRR